MTTPDKPIAAQQETSRGSPVEFRASGVDGKPADAATTCNYKFPISDCPNMKQVQGDLSMTHEHYKCDVCGKRESLDYEEMR